MTEFSFCVKRGAQLSNVHNGYSVVKNLLYTWAHCVCEMKFILNETRPTHKNIGKWMSVQPK